MSFMPQTHFLQQIQRGQQIELTENEIAFQGSGGPATTSFFARNDANPKG
jgi:hypothetical protein